MMNMNNINKIAGILLLAVTALTSCSDEQEQEFVQSNEIRFVVSVDGVTRASMTSADLDLFFLKVIGDNNAFSYFGPVIKTPTGDWMAAKPLLWKNNTSTISYVAAFYGALTSDYFNINFTDEQFTNGDILPVLADQSSQKNLNAADLLIAKKTDVAYSETMNGVVPITMKHGLAKVNLQVTLDEPLGISAEDFKEVLISGIHTLFFVHPFEGNVVTDISPFAKGTVLPYLSSFEEGVATFEAILAPETLDAGALQFYYTLNGKDYHWTNSEAITLLQGGEYTIPLECK